MNSICSNCNRPCKKGRCTICNVNYVLTYHPKLMNAVKMLQDFTEEYSKGGMPVSTAKQELDKIRDYMSDLEKIRHDFLLTRNDPRLIPTVEAAKGRILTDEEVKEAHAFFDELEKN